MTVKLEIKDGIAVVTINNPPVNALGKAVRERLLALTLELDTDPAVTAVVLTGAGKLFVGGADITEFDRPVEGPTLPEVINGIEGADKPWIAAIRGAALGGGLELALGCRFRVVASDARLALPEVSLGLIPGAGGTQRLPRLVGVETAIGMIAGGTVVDARSAIACGLADHIVTEPLVEAAIGFAKATLKSPLPGPASGRPLEEPASDLWEGAQSRIRKAAKGAKAPLTALDVLRLGVEHGYETGIAAERATFLELRASEEAAALRTLFFAERAATRPASLRGTEPLPLSRACVIGGGTMGVGIVAALRNAAIPVILVERDTKSVERALSSLASLFEAAVKRGSLSQDDAQARMAGVTGRAGCGDLSGCDLVIEAVFEEIGVKRAVFAELERACRPDAVLATNTSYIDPRLIAEGLTDTGRFLGLHFFSPAQVMKLLEIVPLPDTRPDVLATGFALARLLDKIPVRSGICDGFIGNRILKRYRREAEALLREGVPPAEIDAAMRGFGYAMGPFEMQDMAGLDISFLNREAARDRGEIVPETPGDLLVRAGRKGQKSGGGWYDYSPGDRTPKPSRQVAEILAGWIGAQAATVASPDAIVTRLIGAMAAEGQTILDEGIATNRTDIDLVEVHGYGFPRWRGGPMFLASRNAI